MKRSAAFLEIALPSDRTAGRGPGLPDETRSKVRDPVLEGASSPGPDPDQKSAATRIAWLALFIAWAPLAAQDRCRPNEPGPWWPTAVQENWRHIPSAEQPIISANQAAAEAIVKKTAYRTPRGFAAKPWLQFGDDPRPNEVRSYSYNVFGFVRCNIHDEHAFDISVIFNPRPMAWSEGDRPMPDENGDGLFTERARSATLFGSKVTFGRIHEENTLGFAVLFTAGGESPTIPVTREEYLKALIFTTEGKNGELLAEATTVRRKEYQAWLARAADRKKENEQILATLATQDPSKVAKTRAEMEKAEKGAGEFLKMLADQEGNEGGARVSSAGDRIRARLASMTPQERAAHAWLVGDDFVAPGTPNANAVVRQNPAFYRARTSPAEVRAILVKMPNRMQIEVREQHLQAYTQFDWAAVKRLLSEKP